MSKLPARMSHNDVEVAVPGAGRPIELRQRRRQLRPRSREAVRRGLRGCAQHRSVARGLQRIVRRLATSQYLFRWLCVVVMVVVVVVVVCWEVIGTLTDGGREATGCRGCARVPSPHRDLIWGRNDVVVHVDEDLIPPPNPKYRYTTPNKRVRKCQKRAQPKPPLAADRCAPRKQEETRGGKGDSYKTAELGHAQARGATTTVTITSKCAVKCIPPKPQNNNIPAGPDQ